MMLHAKLFRPSTHDARVSELVGVREGSLSVQYLAATERNDQKLSFCAVLARSAMLYSDQLDSPRHPVFQPAFSRLLFPSPQLPT